MPLPIPVLYPLVNGVRHSFASIEAKINGVPFLGIQSVDYDRVRSRAEVYGTHPDPIGKTRGQNKYTAEMEMLLAEFNNFQAQTGILGQGWGDFPFIVTVSYSELASGLVTVTDVLIGCTMDSATAKNKVGTEATTRKINLNPVKIIFGGVDDSLIPVVGVNI